MTNPFDPRHNPDEYAAWKRWDEMGQPDPDDDGPLEDDLPMPPEPGDFALGSLVDQLRNALVDTDGLDDLPTPEPVVDGLLYADSLAWLQGKPGHGKSFVALDIAGAVATGETWHGSATTAGPVLYLVAEGTTGLRQRVRAWEKAMGHRMTGVRFLPVAVQAGVPADWSALVELAAELAPALLVIDTQARVTVGMDENSAQDMGRLVHALDRLRLATRACVLVLHHQGRTGDHMRGSTALEGAATTILRAEKDGEQVTVTCAKQKDAPEFDRVSLRLVPMAESVVLATSDGSRGAGERPRWLAAWWAAFRDDPVSVTALVKAQVTTETTFHRAKFALLDSAVIAREGTSNSTRYRLLVEPS